MKLCLTGDLMPGRGIDQILRHSADPRIHERWMSSALSYVELAEQRSGSIPRGVGPAYVWGDALDVLRGEDPDAFIVNLETAVTEQGSPWPGKGIQYRMHPANVDLLQIAGVDAAVLANNHVLDWSEPGLAQTLDVLAEAGIPAVGAGREVEEAWRPLVLCSRPGPRIVVVAAGTRSSGIPGEWAADQGRPGVALLPDLSDRTVDRIAAIVASAATPGDVVVVSLHWGPNWGYDILPEHQRFARALIDRAGAHIIHGHSSHHPLGIEVHAGCLILYGCGDLVTDYEGIHGHEHYRGELGAIYLPTVDDRTGALRALEVVPTKIERFRLHDPPAEDVRWMATVLARESALLGTTITHRNGRLTLRW